MPSTSEGLPLLDGSEKIGGLRGILNALVNAINSSLATIKASVNGIESGAHAYRGTSSQRIAFLSEAVEGDSWQDTDGEKLYYVKKSGVWSGFDFPVVERDLSEYISAPYREIMTGRKYGSLIELKYYVGSTIGEFPPGTVTIGHMPEGWRPSGNAGEIGTAITGSARFFTGAYLGNALIRANGAIELTNASGATRRGCEISFMFLER